MSSPALFRLASASLVASASLLAVWNPGLHAEQLTAPLREHGRAVDRDAPFVADLVVRHRRFDDLGAPVGEASEVSYRLVREMTGGRWVTSMDRNVPGLTVVYPDGPRRLPNPFAPVRVEEVDGPNEELWLIGADGTRRSMPDESEIEALTDKLTASLGPPSRQTVPGEARRRTPDVVPAKAGAERQAVSIELFALTAGRADRRARLAGSFGQVRGRLGGLDKYVRDDKTGHVEVLVNPETALPVEIRSASPTGDQSFTELRYEAKPGRGLVRRLMRSQQKLAGIPGTSVTEVELTHIAVGDEVQP